MNFEHGTDIVEVSRIKKAIEASDRFRNKVFTENEIIYCESRKAKYQSYAVRFAAKEAFLKALGTGWANGIRWSDIEILNDASGKPFVSLYSVAKDIFDTNNYQKVCVSLSHTKDTAIASVIITK